MQHNIEIRPEDYKDIFNKNLTTMLLISVDAPRYTILDVNDAYLQATNSSRETLVGQSVFVVFPANPTDIVSNNVEQSIFSFEEAVRTKMPHIRYNYRYDIPIRGTNEFEERYWTTSNTPVLDSAGEVKFLIHSPTNVTATVKVEERERLGSEALKAQKKQLYSIFMQAPVGIGIFKGSNYTVDLINPTLCKLYGKSFDDLSGKPIFDVLPSVKGQGFEEIIDKVRSTGIPFVGRSLPVSVNRDGKIETAYVNFVYEPFREVDGSITGVIAIATEITEQVENKLKLEESVAQFRFMAESMPQQVWTANAEGALEYVNEGTQNYFGKSAKEIVGAGWQMFIHPDDLPRCMETWIKSLTTGKLYQIEFRLLRPDGKYRWHLARALPFKNNEDVIIKWLGTNTDIEEHKKIEQKKDEFISIASHELKTPLTSLKAYLQLLDRSSKAAGTSNRFIENSLHQLLRLEKLVEDLLDVSRISGGKMVYNMSSFNFKEVIEESVSSVQHATTSHQIIIDNNSPVLFEGDRYRMEQVVTNFLTNAIKYSPDANRVIISSVIKNDNIVVSVQDFGIGIEKSHLSKLFDRFYRVDNTAMKYEGLGLGLYVAAEILYRHKGNFWIESKLGKGSTFFFMLPYPHGKKEIKYDGGGNSDDFYSDQISIIHNQKDRILETDWKGFHNFDSVKAGSHNIIELLGKHKFSKVLNSNLNVLGTWADAAEWVGTEGFPMLFEAGVKYFAWVYSPTIFSKMSAEKSLDFKLGNVVTNAFATVNDAREWLKSVD